jgi:ubiquinone/menaquinone biosynthesis C-methylase UbiE
MHKQTRFAAVSLMVVMTASAVLAQQVASPGVHPISGRRYAQTMSYLGADWLDRTERVEEEEPDKALDALNLVAGSTVADVGAGSGYMTVKMARRVGPGGHVIANDIQPQMLSMLRERLSREKLANVDLILGTYDDPRLPANAIDLILMVDVYHEFSAPQQMLRHMRTALKPGGRLVLLEYRKEDPSIPIRLDHKMTVAEAKMEVEAEGFTLATVDERLPRQHILVFTKN